MRMAKGWPRLLIVAAIFGLAGWGVAALLMKSERKAQALTAPRAARVERVEGEAGLYRGLVAAQENTQAEERWEELTPNAPVTVGDRIYVRDGSQASLAFTGRNFARLEPETAIDVLSLSDERTQLALRDGSAVFNLGALRPGELYEVATPRGAFELREPGFYEVGLNDDGSAWVSVLSGLAQVVGLAGSGQIGKGEMLTLLGRTAADVALSRLSPDYAGGLLNDYYGYQYPDAYDGRYADYNAYLNDPYYYDPYNRYTSYRHVSDYVPGVYELDRYGRWQDVAGYGTVWSPQADAGWAPYRDGYWTVDDPYGLTWVSNEPWGYAPYHYGRWANVNQQWYWVPEGVNTQPAYAPALVAFLPHAGANQIAWVPLAPGEQYMTPYYDANWQPHYYGDYAAPQQIVNLNVHDAVTAVPAEYFYRPVGDDLLVNADPRLFSEARPVVEPFSVALLRQAALETANARRGFSLPPGLAKKLGDTQVYAGARPVAPPFLEGRGRGARAEVVPERERGRRLQFRDERREEIVRQPPAVERRRGPARRGDSGRGRAFERADEAARGGAQAAPFAGGPGRGRQDERWQARELERRNRAVRDAGRDQQQRAAAAALRAERENMRRAARPQGERVAMPRQQVNRETRGRAGVPPRQSQAAAPQVFRPQRGGPPPQAMRQQPRPEQARPQPRPQQQARPQPQTERRQGPPAHAGGGQGGRSQGGPQQQGGGGRGGGKGKGKN